MSLRRDSRGMGRADSYYPLNERIRESGARSVSLALVNHENYYQMRELAPSLWTWRPDGPDSYLVEHERMLASIRQCNPDVEIQICWVDLAEYVEWCRSGAHDVDSVDSWSAYGGAMSGGASDLFDEGDSLWAMSVRDMVYRSEAFTDSNDSLLGPALGGFDYLRDRLTAWLEAEGGDFRVTAVASRWSDCDEDAMWRHFRSALTSPATMWHCDEFLSVAERPLGARSDHYGPVGREPVIDAFGDIVVLAGHSSGIVGVEHAHCGSRTLRAFDISRGGAVGVVSMEELGRRLGARGSSMLTSGWPGRA